MTLLDISTKLEQKILKNEGPDRFLVMRKIQKSQTEIIAFLWNFRGLLALKLVIYHQLTCYVVIICISCLPII